MAESYNKMKRKCTAANAEDDIEDYVMIKCKRFLFSPKNNKLINFCYEFGKDKKDESEVDEKVPVVAEEEEEVKKEEGPVIELVEELITPAPSRKMISSPLLFENFKSDFDSQISEPFSAVVEARDSVTVVVEAPELRPETPKNNPTNVPTPESPIENRMLRNLTISDEKFVIERDKYMEYIRDRKEVEAGKKLLKEQREDFDARLSLMIKIEAELNQKLEDHYKTRVDEIVTEMRIVEEGYKRELAMEREMRVAMEGKVYEMMAFIQQNMQGAVSSEMDSVAANNHQQLQQQEQILKEQQEQILKQQQEQQIIQQQHQQQQHEKMMQQQQQKEFERKQNEEYEYQQHAERVRQLNASIAQSIQAQNHYQNQEPPRQWLTMTIQEEMEDMEQRKKEMEYQKMRQEEQQRREIERQRMELAEQQREDQRRLEMRKMQYMRHVDMAAKQQKPTEAVDKIKEEQNRLFAIQEDKSKADPFALLKAMPNVLGWKSSSATPAPLAPVMTSAQSSVPIKNLPFFDPRKLMAEASGNKPAVVNNNMETDQQTNSAADGRITRRGAATRGNVDLSEFRRRI